MRIIISLVLGLFVTFALFVFMDILISSDQRPTDPPSPTPVIDIISDPPETKPIEKPRLEPKTKPVVRPEVEKIVNNEAGPDSIDTQVDIEKPSLSKANLTGPNLAPPDGEATPIVRVEPRYPIKAAREGKEGWVRLRFTITEIGSVDDVEVLEAEPKRTFDKAAMKALKKWKYKPKLLDGNAISQIGQEVVLEFSLSQ